MIDLAILILPVTTSRALGEYPANWHSPTFSNPIGALGVPIGEGHASDRHHLRWNRSLGVNFRYFHLPHGWLLGYVLAFRWALADQRARCPVCESVRVPMHSSIGTALS